MKNSKNNKDQEKNFQYDILGDAFIGSLFYMNEEIDNTSQNLIMSMESDKIQQEIKHCKKRQN